MEIRNLSSHVPAAFERGKTDAQARRASPDRSTASVPAAPEPAAARVDLGARNGVAAASFVRFAHDDALASQYAALARETVGLPAAAMLDRDAGPRFDRRA